jgi:ferredoxin-type protein NapF
MDSGRRGFLKGSRHAAPLRPPWALADDAAFTQACTRCGDCTKACPQQVLHSGDGGYPEIRFDVRGCTLCGDCVRVCRPAALQSLVGRPPWTLRASIQGACLALRRVECRVCGDACDAQAIGFRPQIDGVALPQVDGDRCTGCGACVAPCPVGAVAMRRASGIGRPIGT